MNYKFHAAEFRSNILIKTRRIHQVRNDPLFLFYNKLQKGLYRFFTCQKFSITFKYKESISYNQIHANLKENSAQLHQYEWLQTRGSLSPLLFNIVLGKIIRVPHYSHRLKRERSKYSIIHKTSNCHDR